MAREEAAEFIKIVLSPSTRGHLVDFRRRQVSWLAVITLPRLPEARCFSGLWGELPLTVAGAATALGRQARTAFPLGPSGTDDKITIEEKENRGKPINRQRLASECRNRGIAGT